MNAMFFLWVQSYSKNLIKRKESQFIFILGMFMKSSLPVYEILTQKIGHKLMINQIIVVTLRFDKTTHH